MELRRLLFVSLAIASAAVLCAAPAVAGEVTIGVSSAQSGAGGEFKVTAFDDEISDASAMNVDTGAKFHTFCIEKTEYLSGINYYEINTKAVEGGLGGGSPDPLGVATARLYYAFWTDQWDVDVGTTNSVSSSYYYDYDTTANRKVDAAALQDAIWYLEGEYTGTAANAYAALGAQAKEYVDYAGALTWTDLGRSDWTGIGKVRIVNMYGNSALTQHKQDQLVVVPLPASALMGMGLLAALAIVSMVRRRRRLAA